METSQGKTALGLDTNIGATLCYVGNLVCSFGLIYSIIVVASDKTNKLTRFHAFQSIFCSILGGVVGAILGVGGAIAAIVDVQIGVPILSLVIGLIAIIVGLGILITYFIAAFKAYKGEVYKMPIIGNFAEKYASAV